MALPFSNKKNVAGLIFKVRQPDGIKDEMPKAEPEQKDPTGEGIRAAAQDLIKAVQQNDVEGVASALRAAFEILDSEPHTEGPHLNKEQ